MTMLRHVPSDEQETGLRACWGQYFIAARRALGSTTCCLATGTTKQKEYVMALP